MSRLWAASQGKVTRGGISPLGLVLSAPRRQREPDHHSSGEERDRNRDRQEEDLPAFATPLLPLLPTRTPVENRGRQGVVIDLVGAVIERAEDA